MPVDPAPVAVVRQAQFPPQVVAQVFAADFLRQQLDSAPHPQSLVNPETMGVLTVTVAGALTVGYVLFYSRVAYLLLSLMSAGSVWREIDPLAFLEYWEQEGRQARIDANEKKAETILVSGSRS